MRHNKLFIIVKRIINIFKRNKITRDLPPDSQAQAAYIESIIKTEGPYTLVSSGQYCKCKTRKGKIVDGWSNLQCLKCKLPIIGVCVTYSGDNNETKLYKEI